MPWKSGESGNLKGRPPNGRALAGLLQAALQEKYFYQGHLLERGAIMAALLAEGVSTGRITFPTDNEGQTRFYTLTPDQWLSMVVRVLGHVDGPPLPDSTNATADLDAVLDWVNAHALPAPTDPGNNPR